MRIRAVIGGGAEIILTGSKLDDGVRRDGGQQLVHACDTDDLAGGFSRRFRCTLLLCLRAGSQSAAREEDEGQHGGQNPRPAFPVGHDLPEPLFQISLFRGEGCRNHAGRKRRGGSHVQKGVAVGLLFLPVHGTQQHLVAAELTGAADLAPGEPGEGIEPLQRENRGGEPFIQGVTAPEVHELVAQNVGKLLCVQRTGRQDDAGVEHAAHQGRLQRITGVQGRLPAGQGVVKLGKLCIRFPETSPQGMHEAGIREHRRSETEGCPCRPETEPEGGRAPVKGALFRGSGSCCVQCRGGFRSPVSSAALQQRFRSSRILCRQMGLGAVFALYGIGGCLRGGIGRRGERRNKAGQRQQKTQQHQQPGIVIDGARHLFQKDVPEHQKQGC